MDQERFVAHRGYAASHPENTLLAMEKAVEAGARYLECDLQLTADRVPVLFHDRYLQRVTGADGEITRTHYADLVHLSAGEPARFGARFAGQRVATLEQFAEFLAGHPAVTAFVEVKVASLRRFGVDATLARITQSLSRVQGRCVLISFRLDALLAARRQGWSRTGWVLKRFDPRHRRLAEVFAPDYLFCNHQFIRPLVHGVLWQGPWRWVLFEIADPLLGRDWLAGGADLVETMDIGRMLAESLPVAPGPAYSDFKAPAAATHGRPRRRRDYGS